MTDGSGGGAWGRAHLTFGWAEARLRRMRRREEPDHRGDEPGNDGGADDAAATDRSSGATDPAAHRDGPYVHPRTRERHGERGRGAASDGDADSL
ncbi:hypothetical protein [Mycetocola reblochoni]|uniref:Uncharacterized protein n=2 Tax=Mycetocola reblochoni TaxID=331618 RepID=A0A1R4JNP0_9MICO|nr:hypothetical protein [Mycetocola reblochoni]RLP68599.1 hypothetical protein D9V30_10020 [Mycetocola reblochoni]SJN33405.1 hypothetical protein FM119_08400 [Mycetocola reblochoni REB411]